jgi:hypothetical protein
MNILFWKVTVKTYHKNTTFFHATQQTQKSRTEERSGMQNKISFTLRTLLPVTEGKQPGRALKMRAPAEAKN